MPQRQTHLAAVHTQIQQELDKVREGMQLRAEFSDEVEAAARSAVEHLELPDADATDIPFVTVDPEGSRDLDQALHITEDGPGHLVHYAIADLPAVIVPGGPIDQEARLRGQTLYAPDGTIPLHPRVISEDGASLLEGVERSAYVWTMRLDGDGRVTATTLERARIRSRSRLTYVEAAERISRKDSLLTPLRTVGQRRIELEAERGGASLDLPEEEIVESPNGWRIERRDVRPVEQWNAQISLMTGMESAKIQLAAGAGIIRNMPRPNPKDIDSFRQAAHQLGAHWQEGLTYGQFLRTLDRTSPVTIAVLMAARRLFRGAGYLVIDGPVDDAEAVHSAIGAPYAHTTAPLRRLVDRYALAHAEAQANGREVPAWATAGLDGLPGIMARTGQLASQLERETRDVVETVLLAGSVGRTFDAVVTERRSATSATIQVVDPPVEAICDTGAAAGSLERVTLTIADVETRTLRFSGSGAVPEEA